MEQRFAKGISISLPCTAILFILYSKHLSFGLKVKTQGGLKLHSFPQVLPLDEPHSSRVQLIYRLW